MNYLFCFEVKVARRWRRPAAIAGDHVLYFHSLSEEALRVARIAIANRLYEDGRRTTSPVIFRCVVPLPRHRPENSAAEKPPLPVASH